MNNDKFILVSAETKAIIKSILEPRMTTLKQALKEALASKNTQNHRVSSDTKRGRQLLAERKNRQDIQPGNLNRGAIRDQRNGIKGTVGKRDI